MPYDSNFDLHYQGDYLGLCENLLDVLEIAMKRGFTHIKFNYTYPRQCGQKVFTISVEALQKQLIKD